MQIQLNNLAIGYGQALFSGVNVCIVPGSVVAILGRNGAGKSTMLKTIAGLLSPLDGEVLLNGKAVAALPHQKRAKLMSLVLTSGSLPANMRVKEIVGLGRFPHTNWFQQISSDDEQLIESSLRTMGCLHLQEKPISSLSDGETQKVMMARALTQDTPVILLLSLIHI